MLGGARDTLAMESVRRSIGSEPAPVGRGPRRCFNKLGSAGVGAPEAKWPAGLATGIFIAAVGRGCLEIDAGVGPS